MGPEAQMHGSDKLPRRAVALTRRYLDPAKAWRAEDERALRTALRESTAAAAHHRAQIVRHRLMTGGASGVPSGFELRRMGDAAITAALGGGGADPAKQRVWRGLWALVGALGAAALVVVATRPAGLGVDGHVNDDHIQARGLGDGAWPEDRVGLGIGGVTADGGEYEAIATAELYADDWLRLTYTNEKSELGWLFVVALQPERAPGERVVWIAPTPEEGQSLAITVTRFKPLPFEVRVGARHVVGRTRFVALFTTRARTLSEVGAALDAASDTALPSEVAGSEFAANVGSRLGLGPEEVVQVIDTRVVAGTAADHGIEAPR